jgi:hypothetical protein
MGVSCSRHKSSENMYKMYVYGKIYRKGKLIKTDLKEIGCEGMAD